MVHDHKREFEKERQRLAQIGVGYEQQVARHRKQVEALLHDRDREIHQLGRELIPKEDQIAMMKGMF